MARVLTRPLFRKGGLSQTPRPTYRGGGLTTIRPRYRNGGMNGIMSGIVPRRGYQLGTGDALGSSWAVGPKVEGPEWHEDIYISPITGTLRKREQEPFVSSARPHMDIIPTVKKQPKIEIKTETPSDQDTIKSYMKMFQEALGEDQEDITRDKYLQLAKFGANLLAQPGGDLTGAIGKSAVSTIEGLGGIEARRRQADREIKLLGIKTAIDQMDDPTLDKIKSLAKAANMPIQEVAKSFVTTVGGEKTRESIITTNRDAMKSEIGEGPALKAARTMAAAELDYALFDKLPVDKEGNVKPDTPNGYYYDEKGEISIIKDGVKSVIKITAKE